jgi:hypothetical protein
LLPLTVTAAPCAREYELVVHENRKMADMKNRKPTFKFQGLDQGLIG